jgi:opacity protein-like surface antigen
VWWVFNHPEIFKVEIESSLLHVYANEKRTQSKEKPMKKRLIFLGIVFLLILGLSSMSYADDAIKGFTLKLGGGMGSWSGSDINNFFLDLNMMMGNTAGLTGADLTGRFEELNYGPDFDGEFILELPQNFAVGIGVGYLFRTGDSTSELVMFGVYNSVGVQTRFTAVPITLNGYYNLPLSAKAKFYIKAGVGYYIGKSTYTVRQESTVLGLSPVWDEEEGDASSSALGFQGGVGFEFSVSENVALFFETMGRYANLKNWKGTNRYSDFLGASESESVDWYYAEEYDDLTRLWYKTVQILDQEPSGSYYRNVRKAEVSYSGVSLRLGIKITFGKKN